MFAAHDLFRSRRWHSRTSDPFRIISGPTVLDITVATIQVTWGLSEIATGQIEYGLTAAYGSTTSEQGIEGGYDFHTQTISGLDANTLYHWRVKSTNAAGTTVYSSDQTTTTAAAPGGEATYPDLLTLAYRALQSVTMPTYLGTVTDPRFGTQVTRVSNVVNQRHRYSAKLASWSATGRYLLLDYPGTDGRRPLLDGDSYQIIQPDISTSTHFVWSPVSDAVAWSTSGTTVYRYTFTDTSYSRTAVANLSQYTSVNIGGGEGSPSNDGRYLPLKVQIGSTYGIGIFDTTTNTVQDDYLYATAAVNNCTMGPSGNYILVQNSAVGTSATQGTWAYQRTNLSSTGRVFITNSLSHRDTCYDPTGSFDQVVIPESNPSGVYAYRLSDGSRIQLCGTTSRIHVSGRSILRPGYAYISHYSVPGEGGNYSWAGYGEVFSLKTDGSEFNQARSYCQTHRAASLGYVGEVHACPSPTGDRVIFASEWAQSGGISGGVYAFVAGVSV